MLKNTFIGIFILLFASAYTGIPTPPYTREPTGYTTEPTGYTTEPTGYTTQISPATQINQYIHAYSSQDLKIWRPSNVLSRSDFTWATGPIYSAAIANRTGKYFLYFSTIANTAPNVLSIGVGVASKPDGPFTDPLKKPLLTTSDPTPNITGGPTVITDSTGGQSYLYYAESGSIRVAKLAPDMINLATPATSTTLVINNSTGTNSPAVPPVSGSLKIFKRNNNYYLLFKKKDCTIKLHYAISDNLNGPFSYIGTFFDVDKALANSFGHATVLNVLNTDFWYVVYSRELVVDDGWWEPSLAGLAYERMSFIDNGTRPGMIGPVKMSVKDDFQNQNHDSDIWREYSGTYQGCLSGPPQPSSDTSRRSTGDPGNGRSMLHNNFGDFIYDIKVSIVNDPSGSPPKADGNAGVVFRVKTPLLTGDSPSTDFAGYFADITAVDKKVILGKADGGKWVYLNGTNLPADFNATAMNSLRVKAVGQKIQVFVNDLTKAVVDTTDATYSAGQTGIKSYNCAARFDDLSITSDVGAV